MDLADKFLTSTFSERTILGVPSSAYHLRRTIFGVASSASLVRSYAQRNHPTVEGDERMKKSSLENLAKVITVVAGIALLLTSFANQRTVALPRCGYNPGCFCLITYEECTTQDCGCNPYPGCSQQVGNCVGNTSPCIYEACLIYPCACA